MGGTSHTWTGPYVAFWKSKPFVCLSLHLFFLIAFFLKMLTGYLPWYAEYRGERYLFLWDERIPAGSELQKELLVRHYDWNQLDFDRRLDPLFRLSGERYVPEQAWRSPLSQDKDRFHWLGTWDLGRDVLVSLFFGLQKSLVIALVSILLGIVWGVPAGTVYAYRGFRQVKLSAWSLLLSAFAFCILLYSFFVGAEIRRFGLLWTSLPAAVLLLLFSWRLSGKRPQVRTNPDFWFMRFLEFGKSVPLMLVVLLVLQLTLRPGMWTLAAIMAFFLGLGFARYARFTTRSLCRENYLTSMDSLGYPDRAVILQYLLPSVLRSMGPLIALSVANVVLLESSLSFLGLGLPLEEVSLGGIMQSARNYPYAWWAVLFPGLCIFWIIYCFQSLDETDRITAE